MTLPALPAMPAIGSVGHTASAALWFAGSRRLGPTLATPPPLSASRHVRVLASPNFWQGRPYGDPVALVLHTMACREAQADAWFANPSSLVSAHWGAALDSQLHAYVRLEDCAWANGILEPGNRWGEIDPALSWLNPNYRTVSIETEDNGEPGQPVTDDEYRATLFAGRITLQRYPALHTLTGHRVISPQSKPNCPGPRWITSGRLAQLAAELGLRVVI